MAVTIDPQTRIIDIPKADLTLVEGTIYEMDVNDFRLELKDIEDDPFNGIYLVDTHSHTPPVTLSGSTYARFVEIINGYRIEFEDGQYQVNLKGANNNIVDVLVRNQVSVVANNSSGLIEADQLEFSSFIGQYGPTITIDTVGGSAGTEFPQGTLESPVDNLADALVIASNRGIGSLTFLNDYTIANGDNVAGYELYGAAPSRTTITFENGSVTTGAELNYLTADGYLGAIASARGVHFEDITGTSNLTGRSIDISGCLFDGTVTLSAGFGGKIQVLDSWSGVAGSDTPIFDLNGSDTDVVVRNWSGGMEIRNFSNNAGQVGSIDFNSGQIIIDSTCTNGTLTVRGEVGSFVDNSGAGCTVNDQTAKKQLEDNSSDTYLDAGGIMIGL